MLLQTQSHSIFFSDEKRWIRPNLMVQTIKIDTACTSLTGHGSLKLDDATEVQGGVKIIAL